MENCGAPLLSILPNKGTSQEERFSRALDKNFFRIEERDTPRFLKYLQLLAEQLKYFNADDIEDGDWSIFFHRDSIAIVACLSQWNIDLLQQEAEDGFRTILLEPVDKKIKLIGLINSLRKELDTKLASVQLLDDEIVFKENVIASSFRAIAIADYLVTTANGADEADIDALIQGGNFMDRWQEFFGILNFWKNKAQASIDNLLENYAGNSPHLTLILTFLRLLKYPLEELNTFTQRHIDFYYQDVLKLKLAESEPDYVHLVIDPVSVATSFEIPVGTIFPAGVDSQGSNKYYRSIANQSINQGKIKKVYSEFFVSSVRRKLDLTEMYAQNDSYSFFDNTIASNAEQGLIISHPVLFLSGGVRTISLMKDANTPLQFSNFKVKMTGKEGWIEQTNLTGSKIIIPESEKAIVAYDAALHADIELKTKHPTIIIYPAKQSDLDTISQVMIKVEVNKFKNFQVHTNQGAVDIKKSFKPFGDFPINGNSFTIYGNELFMKYGLKATIYADMNVNISPIDLNSGNKQIDTTKHELSFAEDAQNQWNFVNYKRVLNYDPIEKLEIDNDTPHQKFSLKHTNYKGQSFMNRYITEAKKKDSTNLEEPPIIDDIYIHYFAPLTNVTTSCFIKTAFGYTQLSNFQNNKPKNNNIYIGIENIQKGDALSLLFDMEMGSANPLKEASSINWQFLSGNYWYPYPVNKMVDDTRGFQQTGIIGLSTPNFASYHTLLDTDLFWLKVEVADGEAICKNKSIYIQSIKAVLASIDNSSPRFLEHTLSGTIKKTQADIPEIKKIKQPSDSFEGRIDETESAFKMRISEHLRHKQRAITSWDYERIILQEFPSIYRVKCLVHYKSTTYNDPFAAGHTTLVCIAKANTNQNPVNWKPMPSLDTIKKIEQKIREIASPHARIKVKAPVLESIQIQCKIKFRSIPGQDNNLYIKKIKELINQILAPWAYQDSEVEFSRSIEISSLIQAIDNCDFVDFIKDFVVLQNLAPVQVVEPSTDFSLFAPNTAHTIEII